MSFSFLLAFMMSLRYPRSLKPSPNCLHLKSGAEKPGHPQPENLHGSANVGSWSHPFWVLRCHIFFCPIPKRTSRWWGATGCESEAAKPDGQVGEEEDFGKALCTLQPWVPPIGTIWMGDEHPWAPASLVKGCQGVHLCSLCTCRIEAGYRYKKWAAESLAYQQLHTETQPQRWHDGANRTVLQKLMRSSESFGVPPTGILLKGRPSSRRISPMYSDILPTRWPPYILGGDDIVIDVWLVCVCSFLLDRFHTSWKRGRSFWSDDVAENWLQYLNISKSSKSSKSSKYGPFKASKSIPHTFSNSGLIRTVLDLLILLVRKPPKGRQWSRCRNLSAVHRKHPEILNGIQLQHDKRPVNSVNHESILMILMVFGRWFDRLSQLYHISIISQLNIYIYISIISQLCHNFPVNFPMDFLRSCRFQRCHGRSTWKPCARRVDLLRPYLIISV